jgi:hypothetical protein
MSRRHDTRPLAARLDGEAVQARQPGQHREDETADPVEGDAAGERPVELDRKPGHCFVSGGIHCSFMRDSSATAAGTYGHAIHVTLQSRIHSRTTASCSAASWMRCALMSADEPKPRNSATFLRKAEVPIVRLWPRWRHQIRSRRSSALPTYTARPRRYHAWTPGRRHGPARQERGPGSRMRVHPVPERSVRPRPSSCIVDERPSALRDREQRPVVNGAGDLTVAEAVAADDRCKEVDHVVLRRVRDLGRVLHQAARPGGSRPAHPVDRPHKLGRVHVLYEPVELVGVVVSGHLDDPGRPGVATWSRATAVRERVRKGPSPYVDAGAS